MVRRLDASLMEDNDSSGTARVARASQQQLAALAQGDPHSFAGEWKISQGAIGEERVSSLRSLSYSDPRNSR